MQMLHHHRVSLSKHHIADYIAGHSRDNILRVRLLDTALDTTKLHKTITVVLANLSNQTILSHFTKLQSSSNWENHNRKLESALRTSMLIPIFLQNGCSKSQFDNSSLNRTATTDSLLIYFSQCTWLSTLIKSTAFAIVII